MTKVNSFSQLRKSSSNFEQLQKKLKDGSGKKDYSDNRFWRATQDKAGNASAVIRFLPAPKGEELPFIKLYSYSFQGPTGQWFIENCPTTIHGTESGISPVMDANNALWNSKVPENIEIARQRKRRLSYIANVYVVSDPANPDNEGKVFLFKFGAKIMDKLNSVMTPEFEDETPINPFDFWEGANFKLKIVKKDGYANYDKSTFDKVGPLLKDDEELEAIWNGEYRLGEFLDPSQFKSYDELNKKFERVIGGAGNNASRTIDEDLAKESAPVQRTAKAPAPKSADDEDLDSLINSADLQSSDDNLEDFQSLVSDED